MKREMQTIKLNERLHYLISMDGWGNIAVNDSAFSSYDENKYSLSFVIFDYLLFYYGIILPKYQLEFEDPSISKYIDEIKKLFLERKMFVLESDIKKSYQLFVSTIKGKIKVLENDVNNPIEVKLHDKLSLKVTCKKSVIELQKYNSHDEYNYNLIHDGFLSVEYLILEILCTKYKLIDNSKFNFNSVDVKGIFAKKGLIVKQSDIAKVYELFVKIVEGNI